MANEKVLVTRPLGELFKKDYVLSTKGMLWIIVLIVIG